MVHIILLFHWQKAELLSTNGVPQETSSGWTGAARAFEGNEIKSFGQKTLFKRAGQPAELAPAYAFFASQADSPFITGQVLHVNCGQGMFS